jgi:N-terminal acetyltransferase B complex catalytic subunit
MGLGKKLMNNLEEVSEKIYDAYFVDLFVRVSNNLAVKMF